MDDVDPEDEPRSFRRAPGWQRLIVLAAGSFMHFVLASVLLFGLALGIGIENEIVTNAGRPSDALRAALEAALLTGAACTVRRADRPRSRPGCRSATR